MGNGAPHNCAIPLPLMVQVVDNFTLAAQKTQIFNPFNRAADIGIGTLHIVPPLFTWQLCCYPVAVRLKCNQTLSEDRSYGLRTDRWCWVAVALRPISTSRTSCICGSFAPRRLMAGSYPLSSTAP